MKAILVVDIPDGYGDVYDNKAVLTLRNGKLGTSLGIYNVPLKPLPQKKEETFAYWIANCNDPESYINGFNACLEEITGETE